MAELNEHKIFASKPQKKRPLKTDLREIGYEGVDWIDVSPVKVRVVFL
jgi:hypothetical protein